MVQAKFLRGHFAPARPRRPRCYLPCPRSLPRPLPRPMDGWAAFGPTSGTTPSRWNNCRRRTVSFWCENMVMGKLLLHCFRVDILHDNIHQCFWFLRSFPPPSARYVRVQFYPGMIARFPWHLQVAWVFQEFQVGHVLGNVQ